MFNYKKLQILSFFCLVFIFCGCQAPGHDAIAKSNHSAKDNKSPNHKEISSNIRIFNPDFYKPGKKYTQRINMVSDLLMMFPNADHKESQVLLNYEVTNVNNDGVAIVEVTIGSIKVSMLSLGQKYSYDSETPRPKNNYSPKYQSRENKFCNEFTKLKGKKYKLAVNIREKTVKILEMAPEIQKIANQNIPQGMLGSAQAVMLLGKSNLCLYASQGLFRGLKSPFVKKSQSWQEKSSVFIPKTPLVNLKKNCKFNSIKQQNKQKLAIISFKYAKAAEQKSNVSKVNTNTKSNISRRNSQFKVVSIKGEGTTTVSLTKGHFVSSKEKIQLGITLNSRGKPAKSRMFYIVKRTVEHIER